MSSSTPNTKTVTGHCMCKAVNFTLDLPTSALPYNTYMCHCTVCRYIIGAFCCFHAPLTRGVVPKFIAPSTINNLARYAPNGTLQLKNDWVFCSTCGTHIATINPREDQPEHEEGEAWTISTSLFAKDESIFKLIAHPYTYSAPSGLHEWLPKIGDRELGVWNPPDATPTSIAESPEPMFDDEGNERLLAQCHCKGVSVRFPRPPPGVTDYVSPVDGKKWIALLCADDSCREATGAHVTAWMYIPLSVVEVGDVDGTDGERKWKPVPAHVGAGQGDTMGLDLDGHGTVKVYESSPGARRSFCGRCGATVMHASKTRLGVVALAMGIVRAPDGVRAEEWVTWWGSVIRAKDDGARYDAEFFETLDSNLKKWSLKKYGEVYNFSLYPPHKAVQ